MAFIPILTPGREDNLGPMQVPHDIYEIVTTIPNWTDDLDVHAVTTRQLYLASIKYWMVTNGSCVVRSGSSSKFGVIQGANECNTILMGDEVIDGMDLSVDGVPPPPPPLPIRVTISANPEAGGYPVTTTLTINPGNDRWISEFFVDWGDGTNETIGSNVLVPLQHTYPIVGDYEIRVHPLDPNGYNYWGIKTVLITARTEE